MVPCTRSGVWNLYVWDMRDKVIHVLDPLHVSLSADELWALHGAFLERLHAALGVCCDEMFSGWGEPFHNYTEHYCVLNHESAPR